MPFILALSLICASADTPPSHLLRAATLLELCRADLPTMKPLAEKAAERLAKGGRLWAAGSPELVSEVAGRAGGLMMIRPLHGSKAAAGDVVLFFSAGGSQGPVAEDGCSVIDFGRDIPLRTSEAGVSPTVAMAASAWVFTGELVAALTRLGRMPVIYETIGAYGGYGRIQKYQNGEIAWHDGVTVKPAAPGELGGRYVDVVSTMLRRVEKQHRADLDRAGEWARQAMAANKRVYMYSMGHMFPDEIEKTEIGKLFRSGVWNAGFRNPRPDDVFHEGDLAVHIGYQHPPDDLLRKARAGGARVAYVAVREDRDFAHDSGVIRIDPMWDWPDACVQLDGYDVPLLPASGIIDSAIAWEVYRLADGNK